MWSSEHGAGQNKHFQDQIGATLSGAAKAEQAHCGTVAGWSNMAMLVETVDILMIVRNVFRAKAVVLLTRKTRRGLHADGCISGLVLLVNHCLVF